METKTTTGTSELEATLKQAWTLFMQNLIIVVPGLISSFVLIAVIAIMIFAAVVVGLAFGISSQSTSADISTHPLTGFVVIGVVFCAIVFVIGFFIAIALAVAQTTFLTGMANAAWERGNTTFADGWKAFHERGFEVFVALLLLLLIGIVAIILAIPTLLLSLLAYLVFFLYVSTSIIVGKNGATHAISESWHLAVRDFVPTLLIAAVSIGVSIVAAIAGSVSGHAFFFTGGLVAILFPIAGRAYIALVVVGHYRKITATKALTA